jgi:hypothetical protein
LTTELFARNGRKGVIERLPARHAYVWKRSEIGTITRENVKIISQLTAGRFARPHFRQPAGRMPNGNVLATEMEWLDKEPRLGAPVIESNGGRSLHEQSHGEAFLTLRTERFGAQGLYVVDEPEAALSPARQLAVISRLHDLVRDGSQFVIATHSPILMAYPDACSTSARPKALSSSPMRTPSTTRSHATSWWTRSACSGS